MFYTIFKIVFRKNLDVGTHYIFDGRNKVLLLPVEVKPLGINNIGTYLTTANVLKSDEIQSLIKLNILCFSSEIKNHKAPKF